jgi:hypothetical protein
MTAGINRTVASNTGGEVGELLRLVMLAAIGVGIGGIIVAGCCGLLGGLFW